MEEDIITDLTVLQERLDKMIIRVELRDSALQQFQALQTVLFAVNSLSEMIDSVLAQTKVFFKINDSSLVLLNQEATVAGYLNDSDYYYQQNPNLQLLDDRDDLPTELTQTFFVGRYSKDKHEAFFTHLAEKPNEVIIMPLTRRGEYLGSLNLACGKSEKLPDKTFLEFVTQVSLCVSICLENHLNFALAQQAYRNQVLANSNNRRFLEQRLIEELERQQRGAHSLSCIILDVGFPVLKDQLKTSQLEIQVLHTVAETVKRQLRIGDVFSYYEGKKFTAFFANAPETEVLAITERLKTAIAEQVIKFEDQIVLLTISQGFASYSLKEKLSEPKNNQQIAQELLAAAGASLYEAKHKHTAQNKRITAA